MPVQTGTSSDGKPAKCDAKNTFGTDGKSGKIKPSRATMCNPALYCTKVRAPYCVAADSSAFRNCSFAQADNADLQFGVECVSGDIKRYKQLNDQVTAICDKESARSLLCDDCKAFKKRLDIAQAKNSSGSGVRPSEINSPTTGGAPDSSR